MRTKIVATIGPRSESESMIRQFVDAGMDIARMNFSHCTHEEYKTRTRFIKAAAKRRGKKVSILQDLKGPRVRVGVLPEKGRVLVEGETIKFSTNGKVSKEYIHINDPYIHLDIKKGDPIFLTNGAMELIATKVSGETIEARVIRGGTLFSNKAVNVPNTKLTTSGLTEKDREDVAFALNEGVDYVALSFVQSAQDVNRLRDIVGKKTKIVSKIESAIALKHIDEIIAVSDVVMVARGDLGIEVPVEKVPFIQKNLIRHAIWHDKGVITATQMLASMIDHERPTRAEVSDIANAVWDGSDAVMLSDETASGDYPLAALEMMVRIVREAETSRFNRKNPLG